MKLKLILNDRLFGKVFKILLKKLDSVYEGSLSKFRLRLIVSTICWLVIGA